MALRITRWVRVIQYSRISSESAYQTLLSFSFAGWGCAPNILNAKTPVVRSKIFLIPFFLYSKLSAPTFEFKTPDATTTSYFASPKPCEGGSSNLNKSATKNFPPGTNSFAFSINSGVISTPVYLTPPYLLRRNFPNSPNPQPTSRTDFESKSISAQNCLNLWCAAPRVFQSKLLGSTPNFLNLS